MTFSPGSYTQDISHTVPVPTPSIVVSHDADTLYAGAMLNVTCDYTPIMSPYIDTDTDTYVTWMVNGAAVDTSLGRISTDGDTLRFSLLATSDSGSYTCKLIVTPIPQTPYVTAQGPEQSAGKDITVLGKV